MWGEGVSKTVFPELREGRGRERFHPRSQTSESTAMYGSSGNEATAHNSDLMGRCRRLVLSKPELPAGYKILSEQGKIWERGGGELWEVECHLVAPGEEETE